MKDYKNNILKGFVSLKNMTRISIYLITCNLLFFSNILAQKFSVTPGYTVDSKKTISFFFKIFPTIKFPFFHI